MCEVKDSKLAAMFSGEYDIKPQEDGSYFLDRNPKVFALVLDYLRNGCRLPPAKDSFLQESFELELVFWQLSKPKDPKLEELKEIFKTIYLKNMDP